ncbi:hypothetical protein IHE71_17860 [Myceligenerans sp. TRM 65318]|uniref:DUF6318 domain-containing protein n=2 Tax=Myceligenerans pegani TaxID=2776917 RepID=A0ABR9N1M5_9MICO|nr:hypothetical protein [Myceligenerans sp. TRM 65318]MBE3019828.1 hypothetical protein [Myceligenerans sp. TRM 65318]
MDRDDAEGAAAAAEYFIELYPYVMATGDTVEFEAMSHEACGFCADALAQAESIRDNNHQWSGGEISSDLVKTYARDDLTGIYPFDIQVDQDAATILDSGEIVFQGAAESHNYRVEVGREADAWIVVEIAPR